MPCRDDYGDSNYASEAKLSGQVACELAKVLRSDQKVWKKLVVLLSAKTLAWIERHDKEDAANARREEALAEAERIRREAKAKLSKAEQDALGIR
jgi:hypothetical protein